MKRIDWLFVLLNLTVLVLVAECSYQKGWDDVLDEINGNEVDREWQAQTLNSPKRKSAKSGKDCFRRYYPLNFERRTCIKPA